MTAPQGFRLYHLVAMLFVSTLLISNTIATKVIAVGPFVLPAGILCFPIAYIFGDVLTEVYGFARTRSVIWMGFACLFIMSLFYTLSVLLPPAVFWKEQQAFARLFGFAPRIAAASFVAYLIGSFLNSIVISRMKVATKGKHLWARTIGSTVVGEGADSLVFNFVAFAGVFAWKEVFFIALSGFILKTVFEVIATPLTYLCCGWLKRVEGIDTYDVGVSYSPIALRD